MKAQNEVQSLGYVTVAFWDVIYLSLYQSNNVTSNEITIIGYNYSSIKRQFTMFLLLVVSHHRKFNVNLTGAENTSMKNAKRRMHIS